MPLSQYANVVMIMFGRPLRVKHISSSFLSISYFICFTLWRTRTTHFQMILLRHTYNNIKTLQSSSLHSQPLHKLLVLHAILQQNNYTSSSFLVLLWPWLHEWRLRQVKLVSKCWVWFCWRPYTVLNKSVYKHPRNILSYHLSRILSFEYKLRKINVASV